MREFLAEHEPARAVQPAVENCRIDPAEIDGVTGIAIVEIGEVRIGPMQAAPNARAGENDRRGGAVIRAKVGVLGQPAAKLGENQEQDTTRFTRGAEVSEERRYGVAKLGQERPWA